MSMQQKRLNVQDGAAGLKPKATAIAVAELAINFNDGTLWTKTDEGTVIELSTSANRLRDAAYEFSGSMRVDDVLIDGNTITSKVAGSETVKDLVIASDGSTSKVQFTGLTQFEDDSTFKKNLKVEGDLYVTGEINTVSSNDLKVEDTSIILNSGDGNAQTAAANGVGLSVQVAAAVGQTAAVVEDFLVYQRNTDGTEKKIVIIEKDDGEAERTSQIATRDYVTTTVSEAVGGKAMLLSEWTSV